MLARWFRIPTIVTALTLGLLVTNGVLVSGRLIRNADHDEGEYLHATWLIANGKHLYHDFIENHSPMMWATLARLMPSETTPDYPKLDVYRFLIRGRIFAAICGTLALIALGLLAFRMTRSMIAPLVAIALVIASRFTWDRAIADVRLDPPSLACLLWGLVLLFLPERKTERRTALVRGFGMALVVLAALYNPKWPLELAASGVLFLYLVIAHARRSPITLLYALAPPAATLFAGLAVIARYAPLRETFYFMFQFNGTYAGWFHHMPEVLLWFHRKSAWYYCPDPFRPQWAIFAVAVLIALLAVPALRRRVPVADPRIAWFSIIVSVLTAIEIRFVYTWPHLWPQYFVFWVFTLSLVYAACASLVLDLVRTHFTEGIAGALTLAMASTLFVLTANEASDRLSHPLGLEYWENTSYMQRTLAGGEEVWIHPDRHPLGATDASYYWLSLLDMAPGALEFRRQRPDQKLLPNLTEYDLPPCKLAPNMRYVENERLLTGLPIARACVEEERAAGRLQPSGLPAIFELLPRASEQ